MTLYPKGESELPLRTLLAISRSDSAAVAEALRVLKQSDDGTVEYTLAIVVQGSRRPLEGARIARLMLAPSRVPQVQAYGHRVLATLQLAQGHWSGAKAELAAAEAIDSGPALEFHALLATAPFLTPSPAEVTLLQRRLRAPAPPVAPTTGSHPMLSVDADIRPLARAYLPGLLSAREGQAAGAERVAGELERRGKSDTLARAFASAIRARLHFVRRDWTAARAALDSARVPVISIASHVSPILSQGYLSFLRAEVLRESAGEEEALRWYDAAWRHSVFNLVYLPPGLFRRGQIEERRGRRAEAVAHYTRFLEFWSEPDSALRPLADSARAGLKRLGVPAPVASGTAVLGGSATDLLKPYRSEAGGFEVNYPDDWSVSAEAKGRSVVVVFTSPSVRDDDVFHAATIMVCSTPVGATPWNDCTERDSHLSEPYRDSVRSRREFVVGGLRVERVETASKDDAAFYYYADLSSTAKSFFVRGNFTTSFHLDRYAPVFDKMLNSFRLLKEAHRL